MLQILPLVLSVHGFLRLDLLHIHVVDVRSQINCAPVYSQALLVKRSSRSAASPLQPRLLHRLARCNTWSPSLTKCSRPSAPSQGPSVYIVYLCWEEAWRQDRKSQMPPAMSPKNNLMKYEIPQPATRDSGLYMCACVPRCVPLSSILHKNSSCGQLHKPLTGFVLLWDNSLCMLKLDLVFFFSAVWSSAIHVYHHYSCKRKQQMSKPA